MICSWRAEKQCALLSTLINFFLFQNLHGFFPQLLSNIFGYSGSTDWGLKNLSRDSREFTAVRRFLSPDGAVFKLINLLQADDQHRYEFFISCLPVSCLFWLFLSSCPSFFLFFFFDKQTQINNENGSVVILFSSPLLQFPTQNSLSEGIVPVMYQNKLPIHGPGEAVNSVLLSILSRIDVIGWITIPSPWNKYLHLS